MIITVTMNPAMDRTVEIDSLNRGGLNRICRAELDVGGKGINVSKTIRELGGTSLATGFMGGHTGRMMENVLKSLEIPMDFVPVDGETRTNTKVFEKDGEVTELNEPGPVITECQMEALFTKLSGYAGKGTLFVLAGSIPQGTDTNIYSRIIRMAHEKGAEVLLDADGELLRQGMIEKPEIVKPNRAELEKLCGQKSGASIDRLEECARGLLVKGIGMVVVSLGKEGAMFFTEECRIKCPALSVNAHSTVGAGDAMAAALAYAWEKKLDIKETVRLCMASSAGAVTTRGTKPPSKDLVEKLKKQVKTEIIWS